MSVQSVISQVRRAYTERTRKLDFLAQESVGTKDLPAGLRAIGRYNEFVPSRVSEAISQTDPGARTFIGREGSVVLYIYTAKEAAMIQALKGVEADEINIVKDVWHDTNIRFKRPMIRAWWD